MCLRANRPCVYIWYCVGVIVWSVGPMRRLIADWQPVVWGLKNPIWVLGVWRFRRVPWNRCCVGSKCSELISCANFGSVYIRFIVRLVLCWGLGYKYEFSNRFVKFGIHAILLFDAGFTTFNFRLSWLHFESVINYGLVSSMHSREMKTSHVFLTLSNLYIFYFNSLWFWSGFLFEVYYTSTVS